MNYSVSKFLVCGALAAGLAGSALAQTVTKEATNNATVQLGGPRTGANGKNFFNIEGSSYTTFVSYGVADFTFTSSDFGGPVASIGSVQLSFVQSNSGFTTSGGVAFYVASNNSASIEPGGGLTFDAAYSPGGIDTSEGQLGDLTLIGSATFTLVSNGTVDTYSFTLGETLGAALASSVNSGAVIRLVVAATDATTAATWAGYTNSNYAGPTMALTAAAIPEPGSCAAIFGGLALAGVAVKRRRRVAA